MSQEDRICSVCGEIHSLSEMELSFRRPDAVCELVAAEREATCQESDDLCTIRAGHFFIRGVLPLPVQGRNDPYRIGVWAEVAEEDYTRILQLWDDPDQAAEAPFAAKIANHIPTLPQTRGVAASLSLRGPTTRPDIHVGDPGHPLYEEQLVGITENRVDHYNHLF
ncbi:MAG: DUF2199 domain-containing protein [Candidatus Omnitrophica bacterium]|nr:DUF2199 domain-containing protein [Candidatus Omnitrophota bacterium]